MTDYNICAPRGNQHRLSGLLPGNEELLPDQKVLLRHNTILFQVHSSIDGARDRCSRVRWTQQGCAIPGIQNAVVGEIAEQRIEANDDRVVIRHRELVGRIVRFQVSRSRLGAVKRVFVTALDNDADARTVAACSPNTSRSGLP